MNKKGQVYLLAAIIIAVLIFSVAVARNVIFKADVDQDFKRLSESYDLESARVLNEYTAQGLTPGEVSPKFGEFSYDFASYARSQNPQFELFYVLKQGDKLLIGNFLNRTVVLVKTDQPDVPVSDKIQGCFEKLNVRARLGGFQIETETTTPDVHACLGVVDSFTAGRVSLCIFEKEDGSRRTCYPFELSGKPQVLIVTGSNEGEQRQVFVGGEGFIENKAEVSESDEE